jgi:hypothetical protein
MSDSEEAQSSQGSREEFPSEFPSEANFDGQQDSQDSEMETSFTVEEEQRMMMAPVEEGDIGDNDLAFPIPKDVSSVPEVQLCVQTLYLSASGKKDRKFFIRMLYDLVCGIACDSVTTEEDPNKMYVVYDMVAVNLITLLDSTLLKKHYFRDHLYHYLPDGVVPDELITYVQTIKDTQPAPNFWSKNTKVCATKSNDARALCYFGFKIWERHQLGKRYVNNMCNPHWKEKVLEKSGNNASAVYQAIRQHLWQSELEAKAELSVDNTIRNQTKRIAKDMKVRNALIDAENRKETVDKIVRTQIEEGFSLQHYPVQWLMFVLLGKPAGKMALGSYNSGVGAGKRKFGLSEVATFRDELGSKASRRKLDKSIKDSNAAADGGSTKSSSSITEDKNTVLIRFAERVTSPADLLEKQISISNQQLEILAKQIQMCASEEEAKDLKLSSGIVLRKMQALLLELERVTSI